MDNQKSNGVVDDIDLKILQFLSKNGKTTYTDIAESVNVTPQTISDRVDKLINKEKVIKRFTIDVDPQKLGYSIEFICELDIDASRMDKILTVLKRIKEIHIIKITTGIHDILCIGNASSIENLYQIVEEQISVIAGVQKTYTSITLKKIKENQILNLDL